MTFKEFIFAATLGVLVGLAGLYGIDKQAAYNIEMQESRQ